MYPECMYLVLRSYTFDVVLDAYICHYVRTQELAQQDFTVTAVVSLCALVECVNIQTNPTESSRFFVLILASANGVRRALQETETGSLPVLCLVGAVQNYKLVVFAGSYTPPPNI